MGDFAYRSVARGVFLPTKPTWNGLAYASGALEFLGNPPGAKFGARKVRRMALLTAAERCVVSIIGKWGSFIRTTSGPSGRSL